MNVPTTYLQNIMEVAVREACDMGVLEAGTTWASWRDGVASEGGDEAQAIALLDEAIYTHKRAEEGDPMGDHHGRNR